MTTHGLRLAAATLLLFLFTNNTFAQPYAELTCPATATNVDIWSKALRQQILSSIDRSLYTNPKVRIKFRMIAGDAGVRKIPVAQLVNGLSISQTGQLATLAGGVAFGELCTYTYVVRTSVAVTESSTGVRLASSTDSKIAVTSSGEFGFRRFTSR